MRYESVRLKPSAEERTFLYDAYIGGHIVAFRGKQVRVIRATRVDGGDWEFSLEVLGVAVRDEPHHPGASPHGPGGERRMRGR